MKVTRSLSGFRRLNWMDGGDGKLGQYSSRGVLSLGMRLRRRDGAEQEWRRRSQQFERAQQCMSPAVYSTHDPPRFSRCYATEQKLLVREWTHAYDPSGAPSLIWSAHYGNPDRRADSMRTRSTWAIPMQKKMARNTAPSDGFQTFSPFCSDVSVEYRDFDPAIPVSFRESRVLGRFPSRGEQPATVRLSSWTTRAEAQASTMLPTLFALGVISQPNGESIPKPNLSATWALPEMTVQLCWRRRKRNSESISRR